MCGGGGCINSPTGARVNGCNIRKNSRPWMTSKSDLRGHLEVRLVTIHMSFSCDTIVRTNFHENRRDWGHSCANCY